MRTRTRLDWHRKVEEAVIRMLNALDEPLHFRQISAELYSSPYHFHRKFRQLTGENVHECLRRLRLEPKIITFIKSAALLKLVKMVTYLFLRRSKEKHNNCINHTL